MTQKASSTSRDSSQSISILGAGQKDRRREEKRRAVEQNSHPYCPYRNLGLRRRCMSASDPFFQKKWIAVEKAVQALQISPPETWDHFASKMGFNARKSCYYYYSSSLKGP
jgi:hypothetical protein